MCVMCLIRADQTFDAGYLETIHNKGNDDGFGLACVEGERYENGPKKGKLVRPGRIKAIRSMGGIDEIKKIYQEHKGKNLIIHQRRATHGDKNEVNCHPYPILSIDEGDPIDLVMMHNGTITNVQIDKKFSDSYNFATIHLRNLFRDRGPSLLQEESFRFMLCSLIGPNNKLIFLDNRERVTIINYEQGSIHPATGVWLSTKDNLALPKPPYIAPVTPIQRHAGQFASGDTEPSAVKISGEPKMTWKQPDGSKWVIQSDGRSHFIPATLKPQVDEPEQIPLALPAKARNLEEIKELIMKSAASDKPEDQEALKKSLSQSQQHEIFQYVLEFPVEAAALINYMARKTDLLPEFAESSIEDTVNYCLDNPWMAAHAITLAVRLDNSGVVKEKEKVHEVN